MPYIKERLETMAASEPDLLVIKKAMEPLWSLVQADALRESPTYRPSDIHFTLSGILALFAPESSEKDPLGLLNFSAAYSDVKRVKLRKRRSEHWLDVNYWSGKHHWWSTTDTSFRVTKEQFGELRTLLPSILGLSGKVELPKSEKSDNE